MRSPGKRDHPARGLDGKGHPPARGRKVARVPALVAAKLALHGAMLDEGVSNVMLAARLGVDEKAVRRLRDPMHRSHIAAIETALRTLGKQIEVTIAEAA